MAKTNIKNLPTKKKKIESYPREKGGKTEIVTEHTKDVHVKPALSKAIKKQVSKGKAKSLIEKVEKQKDKFYEKDIQDWRTFNEKDYSYQGTFRTKALAEKDLMEMPLDKPLQFRISRIIKTTKGYRLYTYKDETDDYYVLQSLSEGIKIEPENLGELYHDMSGYLDLSKLQLKKSLTRLMNEGWILKKVGTHEILFKPSKRAKNYFD